MLDRPPLCFATLELKAAGSEYRPGHSIMTVMQNILILQKVEVALTIPRTNDEKFVCSDSVER